MFFKSKGLEGEFSDGRSVGRVYVIELLLLDGVVIHKIGMTNTPRSTDRMMEILRSWFIKYRYVPQARLRLDKETPVPLLLEQHLHKVLEEWKWIPEHKVEGSTEMFIGLDEPVVLDYIRNFDYNELLKVTKIRKDDYDKIIKEINKDLPDWIPPTIDF